MTTADDGKTGQTSRIARFRAEVAQSPDDAAAHFRLGTALVRGGAAGEATAVLERAVALEPSCVEAWVNLGGARLSRLDFAGCVEANRKAAEVSPDCVQAHYNRGLGHLYLGQPAEMATCFERVVAVDPDSAGGHYHLAVALLALERPQESRASLSRAMELGYSPQPDFIRELAREGAPSVPIVEIEGK